METGAGTQLYDIKEQFIFYKQTRTSGNWLKTADVADQTSNNGYRVVRYFNKGMIIISRK